MAEGPGYFISPTGEVHRVTTHMQFVREHGEIAGLTPDEARTLTEDDRPHALRAALQNRWIRLRHQSDGLHVELWTLDDDARLRLQSYLQVSGSWNDDRIVLGELATDSRRWTTAREFLK